MISLILEIISIFITLIICFGAGYFHGRRIEFELWDRAEIDKKITIHSTNFLK